MRYGPTFRDLQATSDLRQYLRSFNGGAFAAMGQGDSTRIAAITMQATGSHTLISKQDTPVAYDDVWRAAVSPDENRDAFLAATALLLLNSLQNPIREQGLGYCWLEFADQYRQFSSPARAAIMNGFKRLQELFLIDEECLPNRSDLITNDPARLLSQLKVIARSATSEEINSIAKADYSRDFKKHQKALIELLASETILFQGDDRWFPEEVVELVSHVPSGYGFLPCTAIILLNALHTCDAIGGAEFRWSNEWKSYQQLPSDVGPPILNAFRHLYESVEDWNSLFVPSKQIENKIDVAIPWYRTQE